MTYQLKEDEARSIADKFNSILTGTKITQHPFAGYTILSVMPVMGMGDNSQVNILIKKGKDECVVDLFDYLISTEDYF